MPRYVGLLRAVNLGGDTVVRMDALRSVMEDLGATSVRTLLASGNVVFDARKGTPASWETAIEAAVAEEFGRPTEVFVRTAPEWRSLVERNPYPTEARNDPGHLLLCVLKAAPAAANWSALRASTSGRERADGEGRAVYLVYPDGVGGSKLTALRIERALGTRGTSRNWNTVEKLDTLLSETSAMA